MSTRGDQEQRTSQSLNWSGVLAEQGYVVGVDISGSGERAVLSDLSGNVVARDSLRRPTAGPTPPGETVSRVTQMVRGLLESKQVRPREVLRMGVGFGGPVDAAQGVVLRAHDAPNWDDFPLAPELEKAFEAPVLLDNDSRLAALGEVWFGAGCGSAECDLIYVHWSTGVGGGIVAGGRLVRGSTTIAGEIGHVTVRSHGNDVLPCRCGGKGHLEAYVRSVALVERAKKRMGEDAPGDEEPLTPAMICTGADSDPRLKELVDETVDMLALTVGNLITVLNPALVVIGGRVARECSSCIPRIADLARQYAMPLSARAVEIVPAELGEEAGVMGAVALALESLR